MNYERIVQWVAGPFAVAVGGVATKLVASQGGLLSAVGVSQKSAAHTVTAAVVFGVSAAVTYAGHHKWLTNAAKWWEHSGLTLPAGLGESAPPDATVTTGPPAMLTGSDTGPNASKAALLREQLTQHGIDPIA